MKFPAIKGMQAGREYYTVMVPLSQLQSMFPLDDDDYLPPDQRAQRKLNRKRVPNICNYLLQNQDTYVFSALAASVDGEMTFTESDVCDSGTLFVSDDAQYLVNDGQHRIAAIVDAIQECEHLAQETIPIVLYKDVGLKRSQQIFTDLNKHAVRTSNSLSELYDSRDELAVITRQTISGIPLLKRYTDLESDNLGHYAHALFTLNMFYRANEIIVGTSKTTDCDSFIKDYWDAASKYMKPWRKLCTGSTKASDIREKTIAGQAVFIKALGAVGFAIRSLEVADLDKLLKGLSSIDWQRSNELWIGRTVNGNGKIITSNNAVTLTASAIKAALELPLSPEESRCEKQLENQRRGGLDA